jgi:predicted lactoylglutathione lyase
MSDTACPRVFECIIPILNVAHIEASVDFYRRALGFQQDWRHQDDSYAIAGISRDGLSLYLCQGDEGQPGTWVWIGVEELESIYRQCQAAGAKILMEPTNFSWAYEMRVEDPDGHVLRIATEPKSGEPH